MLGATIAEEPRTVDEAFKDKRWVTAMDSEYAALMKNKTWHLVPYPKGKNILAVNVCIKSRRKQMVLLTDTKPVLLPRGSSKGTTSIMRIPSVLW
jgi:histone deacetylase 1/2